MLSQPQPTEILFGAYRRQALADLHERLDREINPVIMSMAEFNKKCTSDPFLQRVVKETRIYVMGGADDFAKLVGGWTV